MADIMFLDELPAGKQGGRGGKGEFRLALEAHPGKWARYYGSANSVYKVAQQMSTNGAVFKAATRDGIPYMTCVKP